MIRRTLAALAIAASGLLPLGLLALPGNAPAPEAAAAAPARIDAIPAEQHAAPAERHAAELAPAPDPLDLAFLADLLGPDADLTDEEALHWTELGRRYCALAELPPLPGAEPQTRESWLAGLTDPRVGGLQPSEAEKLLDTATAAYCPERTELLAAPAPAPQPAPAQRPQAAAPAPAQAPQPAAPSPAAEPAPAPEATPSCPGTTEWQGEELGCVQPQLPEESLGGARCPGDELIARLPDGSLGCPSGA